MKKMQNAWALLLCLLLLIGATACDFGDLAGGKPNVGNSTSSAVNDGSTESKNTIQNTVTSMPENGDPLTEVVGLWAHESNGIVSPVRITEDGKWGHQDWTEEMEPSSTVVYSNGAIYRTNGISIWVYIAQDGKYISDNGSTLMRYSDRYTAASAAPAAVVGTWQFTKADIRLVIHADGTWEQRSGKGEKIHEGFIASAESDSKDDYVDFISDSMPPFKLAIQNASKLLCYTFGDYGDLTRIS